jgi:cysteine desulfuration protein SufE
VKLDQLLAEFEGTDPEEALEILMDFGGRLPPISAGHEVLRHSAGCRVQECQTPVYLWVDVTDGRVQIEADVPEQSPTVRGLVAMLVEGISGSSREEVLSLPDNLLPQLGLQETLGMTRQRGFQGILGRIKRAAATGESG